jgi:hypothetical protein
VFLGAMMRVAKGCTKMMVFASSATEHVRPAAAQQTLTARVAKIHLRKLRKALALIFVKHQQQVHRGMKMPTVDAQSVTHTA